MGFPPPAVELCSTEIEPGRSQCRIEFIRFQSRAVQAAPEPARVMSALDGTDAPRGGRARKPRDLTPTCMPNEPASAPYQAPPLNGAGLIRICRLRLAPASGISAIMELWPSG